VQALSEEAAARAHSLVELEAAKEHLTAVAQQHTLAAAADEEEVAAMRAAIEANNDRIARLRKQRQELEVRVMCLVCVCARVCFGLYVFACWVLGAGCWMLFVPCGV
jgi:hypothetical protein